MKLDIFVEFETNHELNIAFETNHELNVFFDILWFVD